ncbi:TonB-dependent receptor [Bacteroides sp. 214]|uniref:TonB-dependent receptor n=1 Tax=Bacteroides sp. 214 TaxID=2302935 RepID=UPI0013CF9D0A|nr:TonB-dependent receptor [Bacteroides sp. 214]NDW12191.1 TonB-dependent receptor [Bacteroides sp. 214]
MRKRFLTLLLFVAVTFYGASAKELPVDTLKVIDIEEVIIIASPKESRKLREQANAVTLLSQQDMQANQVKSIKNLTSIVPNIFIPDYGSRLTSAIYIRGVGSRINTPSVGLYVDNVPFIDKSAFDFNYSDIERIDVLRGPQGTLYGRNSMGGLIRVHTKSPFNYQGTDVKLSAATYNNYNASLTHYHRISEKFAFSAGGFYEYAGGFFENATLDNKKVDKGNAAGGRMRGIYLPGENLKIDFSLSYEYSDEGGYAYGMLDKETGKFQQPAYNDESSYYRNLLNSGLNIQYQGTNFLLSSVTGFQHLKDHMFIDNDFTSANVFTLGQKQKQSTITEEITFRNRGERRWEWVVGAFGFYQWLKTDAPVNFKSQGLAMIENQINKAMAEAGAPATVDIIEEEMPVSGLYDTPSMGAAIFHQSTINDFLFKGLSATIGLRLDYEKNKMTHDTQAAMSIQAYMMGRPMGSPRTYEYIIDGKESVDYTQLLPKFALKYDFDKQNNIYASASRGYRSGGYNLQMFSDLIQAKMMSESKPGSDPVEADAKTISYKPEYSWNYEVGSHLTLAKNKLWTDISVFFMDTKDQQIAKFAPSGLGRMMENAGRSHSHGGEISIKAKVSNPLTLNINYGYTHATFRKYDDNESNYKGKYVPFVPQNTLNAGAEYVIIADKTSLLDEVRINVNYNAAGKIYWTEANDASQKFYGTLNWRISAITKKVQVDVWARNFLDKEYTTFYFETMGNSFRQQSKPMQVGMDIRCRF